MDWKSLIDISGGPDACHPWRGPVNTDGYGQFKCDGKTVRAHRAALAEHLGRDVDGCALHSCDNPACCNWRHLREGTQQENIADMDAKGRRKPPRGAINGRAKLSDTAVSSMRADFASGLTNKSELGRRYGVSNAMAGRIVRGEVWR